MTEDTKIHTQQEFNMFNEPRSSVKLKLNSKDKITWDIKVVSGEEHLLDGLMKKAVDVHLKLKEIIQNKTK